MRREARLRESGRFSLIRREKKIWVNGILALKALANSEPNSRFGFIATKRIGNAVVRNRIRRQLREILRVAPVIAGYDLVFIVRKRAASSDFNQIRRAVYNLLRRSRMLDDTGAQC